MKGENVINEVLAVKYAGKCIFLGIGSTLYIVNQQTLEIIYKFDPFYPHSDKIHGIEKCYNNKILLFGGKCVQFFRYEIVDQPTKCTNFEIIINFQSRSFHFPDWIIKARLFESNDKNYITILFAHNYLCTYDVSEEKEFIVQCEEQCLLYSGDISGEDKNNILIFSGTVFKEILIWNSKDTTNTYAKILRRLKGHNGVIFSVKYDMIRNLICSTSDDRSVRLWQVKSLSNESVTGIDWKTVEIYLCTTMFGHIARVWTALIGQKTIISVGEDSQICFWSQSGKLIKKLLAHNGAPIWSIDISEDEKTIVTGAGDGSVTVWKVDVNDVERMDQVILKLPDEGKMPKHVRFLENGFLLVLQEKSEACTFETTDIGLSQRLHLNQRYSNYCLTAVSPGKNLVALASIDGFVTLYKSNKDATLKQLKDERLISSKIFSIHFLSDNDILICGDEGDLKLFTFHQNEIHLTRQFVLPNSRERWVTATTKQNNFLICGDRLGSIFIYDFLNDSKHPIQILPKIHGMGVQSCSVFNDKQLITTGRDGKMKFYKFKDGIFRHLRDKHLPMCWVAKTVKKKDVLLVFGFSETDFVIYDTALNRILCTIHCGGGHRSWDLFIKNDDFTLSYIRNKKVYIMKINLANFSTPSIMEGFHTKICLSFQLLSLSKTHATYISASEDCTLKLCQIINEKLKIIATLEGHISSVRCLDILNLNENSKMIISAGGRAQLKIWQVDFQNGVVSDFADINSFMLKGNDCERRKMLTLNKKDFDVDPETRFMDVKVVFHESFDDFVCLFLACSDGFLRTMIYDMKMNKITLKNELSHGFRCILKVHSLIWNVIKCGQIEIIVLTMTTNGFVHFWKIDVCSKEDVRSNPCFGSFKIHQCGINSYDLKILTRNEFFLATGGDDNLLKVTKFTIDQKNERFNVKINSEIENTRSHSAKITGVKFLQNNRIISVGADQKVIIHSVMQNNMTLVDEMITSVSDAQGLTTFTEKNDYESWYVYGNGLQRIQRR